MALQRVKRFVTSEPGRKPFFGDWVDAHDESVFGSEHEVTLVRETNSRAGYLLETDSFVLMLYKSQAEAEELLEEIDALYQSVTGGALFIIVDPGEPSGYYLATDTEIARMWLRTKKYPGGFRYKHKEEKRERTRGRRRPAPPSPSN